MKPLKIPRPQLYAGILIFATVGAYGMRQSTFDLFLLHFIGLLGEVDAAVMTSPTAPVVVGMILGPLAEAQMRNAVSIAKAADDLPAALHVVDADRDRADGAVHPTSMRWMGNRKGPEMVEAA